MSAPAGAEAPERKTAFMHQLQAYEIVNGDRDEVIDGVRWIQLDLLKVAAVTPVNPRTASSAARSCGFTLIEIILAGADNAAAGSAQFRRIYRGG